MCKISKYEYLSAEEVLPPDQSRIIEQAKFRYFPLGIASEKQIKAIGKHEKQLLRLTKKKILQHF